MYPRHVSIHSILPWKKHKSLLNMYSQVNRLVFHPWFSCLQNEHGKGWCPLPRESRRDRGDNWRGSSPLPCRQAPREARASGEVGMIVFSSSYCFHLSESPAEIALHLTSAPHELSFTGVSTLSASSCRGRWLLTEMTPRSPHSRAQMPWHCEPTMCPSWHWRPEQGVWQAMLKTLQWNNLTAMLLIRELVPNHSLISFNLSSILAILPFPRSPMTARFCGTSARPIN